MSHNHIHAHALWNKRVIIGNITYVLRALIGREGLAVLQKEIYDRSVYLMAFDLWWHLKVKSVTELSKFYIS